MTTEHDLHAIDLTQLSSREQLSALMDSALPADQTRFLLRRLRHDDALAGSWERWRLAGEVMRGLAPERRLPPDFATRVAAALHGPALAAPAHDARAPRWRRWGGGVAVAASLAVAALALRPAGGELAEGGVQVAAGAPSLTPASPRAEMAASPVPASPASAAPVAVDPLTPPATGAAEALATVVAAAAVRPSRARATDQAQQPATREAQLAASVPASPALAPQPDIVTRPWPRSVLPQYAGSALTVGLGEPARDVAPYNPFESPARFPDLPSTADQAPPAPEAGPQP